MTATEKRVVEAARQVVKAWLHAKQTKIACDDANKAWTRDLQSLVSQQVAFMDYQEAFTSVSAKEVELTHAVMAFEDSLNAEPAWVADLTVQV